LLFCLLTAPVTTEPAATPAPTLAPDAREVALLDELVDWVADESRPDGQALAQTIRQKHQSFEVFRSFHAAGERRALVRRLPFGPELARVAERYGLDCLLLAAVVEVESSFNPQALSHRGAVGLMQLMPSTAGHDPVRLTDPEVNLDAGARYLAWLLRLYDGDLTLALAAYNAGPGAVERFGGLPPYRETQRFVEKVLSIYVDHHRELWQQSRGGELLALL